MLSPVDEAFRMALRAAQSLAQKNPGHELLRLVHGDPTNPRYIETLKEFWERFGQPGSEGGQEKFWNNYADALKKAGGDYEKRHQAA